MTPDNTAWLPMTKSHDKVDVAVPDVTVTLVDDNRHDDRVADSDIEKASFSFLSAFGLAFSVINSWVVLVVGLGSGLISGGPSVRE
jgi:hypothetical protein